MTPELHSYFHAQLAPERSPHSNRFHMPDTVLSPQEVRRRLRMIASADPVLRKTKRLPGIRTVAVRANANRSFLNRIAAGQQVPSFDACRRLSAVLLSLES